MAETQDIKALTPAELDAQAIEKRRTWRAERKRGKLLQTASGLVLRVKSATLIDLVRAGHIPQPLIPAIESIFNTGKMTMTEAVANMKAVEAVVCAVVTEPKIVEGPTDADGELGLDEMTADEKLSVVNYVNSTPIGMFNFLGNAAK